MAPRSARRMRTVALAIPVIGAIAAIGGAAYQDAATRAELAAHPAPGVLANAGGLRLHLWCKGEGSPTVILDAGLGGSSLEWFAVHDTLAEDSRVCAVDRAGLGWSDEGPRPRIASRLAEEQHVALSSALVPGPYVLVAHSVAGLYARAFAAQYPGDVAGLVLVDATPVHQFDRSPAALRDSFLKSCESASALPRLAFFGLTRLQGLPMGPPDAALPEAYRGLAQGPRWRTAGYRAVVAEMSALEASMAEVAAMPRPPPVPLAVVVAGRAEPVGLSPADAVATRDAWLAMQDELVQLTPYGRKYVAETAGHFVHVQEPAVVVRAVGDVVAAVRAGGKVVP